MAAHVSGAQIAALRGRSEAVQKPGIDAAAGARLKVSQAGSDITEIERKRDAPFRQPAAVPAGNARRQDTGQLAVY